MDRETLLNVARTSLCTKVDKEIAEILTEVCVCACVLAPPDDTCDCCSSLTLDSGGCCFGNKEGTEAAH